ncbi:MAG: biotin/lipoate A/B protein ligase family protein [Planctomycetia bacterium]
MNCIPATSTSAAHAFRFEPRAPAEWLSEAGETVADNLALDEALLEEAHEGIVTDTVVRTWMAAEPTVVLGSSSRVEEEVDLDACRRLGVRVARRPSGGLTVVIGPGCLMWSVVVHQPVGPPSVDSIHRGVLGPLVAALRQAGAAVDLLGSSDLAVGAGAAARKVSGNALRVRRHGVLYHGTLLDAFDLALIGRVLRHPPREPAYRAGRSHGDFLANLGLGTPVLEAAVRTAFSATRDRRRLPIDRVDRLVRERYANPDWTTRRG